MHLRSASPKRSAAQRRQQGAALLISLIFLIVLTVIGIGVVGTTTSEEKLARNFRDMDIAFAAAEATLRDAEVRIAGTAHKPAQPLDKFAFPDIPGNCNTEGLCDCMYDHCNGLAPVFERYSLTESPSVEIGTGTTGTPEITQVSAQPRYLIEKACHRATGESASAPKCLTYYRITSLSRGRLSAQTMLQETYIP